MSLGRHGRNAAQYFVVDEPSLGERGRHGGGDVGCLSEPQGVGGAQIAGTAVGREVVVAFGAEYRHGAVREGGRRATRIERLECRLRIGLERDEAAEDVVGEVDHGLRRAEVGRQRHSCCADLIGRAQVLGDVGSPEAVDRLLGVTDDEQASRERLQPPPGRCAAVGRGLGRIVGVGGETDGDLELDRVGVLEFVEKDPLVPGVKESADVGSIGEETSGEHEQVVELEQAGLGATRGGVEDETPHHRSEQESPVSTDTFEEFVRDTTEFDLEALKCLEVGRTGGSERLGPLPLRSRPTFGVAPVPEAAIELDDQFESDSDVVGRRQIVDQLGDVASGLDLCVVGRQRCGGDCSPDGEQGSDVDVQRPGIAEVDAVVDEVPVGPEVLGHATGALVDAEAVEFAQLDECPASLDHAAGRIGLVEQAVEQVVPLLLELQRALEFVEDGETGWQARFDREVEQHPPGERVQGPDRRMVEPIERGAGASARIVFEARAGAAAQFCRGLLGERDRRDGGDRHAGAHEVDDARDQGTRLAGTGTGLDEERGVEIGSDADAGGFVGRRHRHGGGVGGGHASSPTGPNQGARRGSCCLRSHSAHRSAVPRWSGSQYSHET